MKWTAYELFLPCKETDDAHAPVPFPLCSASSLRAVQAARANATRSGCGATALSVQLLCLPTHLYSSDVAAAAAGSFPSLTALELSGPVVNKEVNAFANRLVQHLKAASRPDPGSAAADSDGVAAAGLQSLVVPELRSLPVSLGDALSTLPQLTQLSLPSLDVLTPDSQAAVQLSRLTQLQRLDLNRCHTDALAAVLSAMSRLTELSLVAGTAEKHQLRFRAPAPALTKLTVRGGQLDAASFAQLPALQQLEVARLCGSGVPPEGGWQLPPQLTALTVSGELSVTVAAQLHAPEGMRLTCGLPPGLSLAVDAELRAADPSVEYRCQLTTEGSAALCRALCFLGKHAAEGLELRVTGCKRYEEGPGPVGGPDGAETTYRSHAWLTQLGAVRGAAKLTLEGWRLREHDIEALARLDVCTLELVGSSVTPITSLSRFGRAPSLRKLVVDVGGLCYEKNLDGYEEDEDEEDEEDEDEDDAENGYSEHGRLLGQAIVELFTALADRHQPDVAAAAEAEADMRGEWEDDDGGPGLKLELNTMHVLSARAREWVEAGRREAECAYMGAEIVMDDDPDSEELAFRAQLAEERRWAFPGGWL